MLLESEEQMIEKTLAIDAEALLEAFQRDEVKIVHGEADGGEVEELTQAEFKRVHQQADEKIRELSGKLLGAEARLKEAEGADDEMERRCDQLRAALEEADAGRLRAALESEVISLHKWHRHNSEDIYKCQECDGYEWTARMLAALRAEPSQGGK